MKIDLKVLSAHLDRTEETAGISRDGVNDYLLDKILFPCMNGAKIHLNDIDFSAFEMNDVDALEEFHERLEYQAGTVRQLAERMCAIHPAAAHFRSFC